MDKWKDSEVDKMKVWSHVKWPLLVMLELVLYLEILVSQRYVYTMVLICGTAELHENGDFPLICRWEVTERPRSS